jgi:hypothetical protein
MNEQIETHLEKMGELERSIFRMRKTIKLVSAKLPKTDKPKQKRRTTE